MAIESKKSISSSINLSTSREYKLYAEKIILREFNLIKNNFINSFYSHPVTKEIAAGPKAANISGTLGGQGNLFSFIGFPSNAKPLRPIELLFKKIFINSIRVQKDGSITNIINYPKPKDVFGVTPMPWADGLSWAEGIERGITNLGFFMSLQTEQSRSGEGLQAKNKVQKSTFNTRPYISSMIRDFELSIFRLNNMTL